MMSKTRRLIFFVLVFAASLTVLYFIGSIDSNKYDDLGLSEQEAEIPDSKNGFSQISYTQDDGFKLFKSPEIKEELRLHISHEEWNESFVLELTLSSQLDIESAVNAMRFPFFKLPEDRDFLELPDYGPIVDLSRLLLLKSMHFSKNANLDEAIEYAGHAVVFSQKVKSNNLLISHMVGLVQQYEAVSWLHLFASSHDLSAVQHSKVLSILDKIPSYRKDSFNRVFHGEYQFSKDMISNVLDRPFKQRWNEYWQEDWWAVNLDGEYGFGGRSFEEEIFTFLQMIAPKYYLHKNRSLSALAKQFSTLRDKSDEYCNKVTFGRGEHSDIRWADLVKPNSLMGLMVGSKAVYEQYYARRCFGHAHVESVRAAVAILQYKSEVGELPDSLNLLVPKYLRKLPIDPFNGKELNYSKENKYIYSVGANFLDGEGSLNAVYSNPCRFDDECYNNPTTPIYKSAEVYQ